MFDFIENLLFMFYFNLKLYLMQTLINYDNDQPQWSKEHNG
jgi:hypothetical protein